MAKLNIRIAGITAIVVIGVALFFIFGKHNKVSPAAPVEDTPFVYTPPDNREKIPQPSAMTILPDSTKVYLIDSSSITALPGFKSRREVKVDGDMFFEVPDSRKPMIIRTRLMTLKVTGKSVFRVIAYRKEDGEEVQVISGKIHVIKAYKSQFAEPEDISDNQMVMINITIDLMEKEKFDTRDLRAWRDTMRIPAPL